MNELKNKFNETFKTTRFTDLLKTGVEIKRADKSTTTRVNLITLISCIGMGVLGYIALDAIGAIIFLIITYTASFSLNFSMKKKVLLAYLKFYREKLPPVLYEGSIKIDKPSIPSSLSVLYPDTLHHWTVCYRLGEVETGFARVMSGNSETASGMAVIVPGKFEDGAVFKGWFPALGEKYCDSITTVGNTEGILEFATLLETRFETFALKTSDEYAVLYIPCAQDFMTSRTEDADGLTPQSLAKQFAYFTLAEAFGDLNVDKAEKALAMFDGDYSEEDAIYRKLWEKKKK